MGSQLKKIDFYILQEISTSDFNVVCQAPVAQLDRAPDYESGGWGFKSLRARHEINKLTCQFITIGLADVSKMCPIAVHIPSFNRFRIECVYLLSLAKPPHPSDFFRIL